MPLRLFATMFLTGLLTVGACAAAPAPAPVPAERLAQAPGAVRAAVAAAYAQVEDARERSASPGATADAYEHLGDVLYVHEFFDDARAAYGNAAALAPNRISPHYLLGLLAFDEGDMGRALTNFDRVLELDDRHALALLRRGWVYLNRGDPNAAALDFNAALALDPDSAAALAGLGRAALDQREFEAAVDHLSKALERSPTASRLHHTLALAYRGLGQRERAREHLARSGDVAVRVDDSLEARVGAESRSAQLYLALGVQSAADGDLDTAVRQLVTAYQLAPDNPHVLLNYGAVLARLGRFDEAQSVLSRLAAVDATAANFLYLGRVEQARGEAAAAVAAYTRAVSLDASHYEAREELAYLQLEQGEFVRAAANFATLADQSGNAGERARNLYLHGMAALGGGECAVAGAALESARAEAQEFIAPIADAIARMRSTCGGTDAALEEALAWAQRLYANGPGLESAETLAMVHAALGRFEDGVDFQAQAMFEAMKSGELEQRPALQVNMARYRNRQAAERAYAHDDPVFSQRFEAHTGTGR
ncbi:MAG: tetratricopeptide repeat protein [Xanthomonadaceae bacterium]|nr:tetratricopeptide repeat protein [Xanthomonadaceae bacterium]